MLGQRSKDLMANLWRIKFNVKNGIYLGSSLKGSKLPTLRKGGQSPGDSDRSSRSSATKYLAVSRAVSSLSSEHLDSHTFTLPSSWPGGLSQARLWM